MSDIYLANDKYEIKENKEGDCYIKQLHGGKFFFKRAYFASKKFKFEKIKFLKWNYRDTVYSLLIFISLISLYYLMVNSVAIFSKRTYTTSMIINVTVFMLANVVLHEVGHILTLRFWGRRSGKLKFKFYYIFPIISVDTSDVYIISKFRGVCVCYAGVMTNIFICAFVLKFYPEYNYVIIPVASLIFFSLIPFSGVKTDGYNLIIIVMFGIKELKGKKTKVSSFFELALNIMIVSMMVYYFVDFFSE